MNEKNFKEWVHYHLKRDKKIASKVVSEKNDEKEMKLIFEVGPKKYECLHNKELFQKLKKELELEGVELIRYAKISEYKGTEKWVLQFIVEKAESFLVESVVTLDDKEIYFDWTQSKDSKTVERLSRQLLLWTRLNLNKDVKYKESFSPTYKHVVKN